jgi:hypothetical protein
MLCAMYVTLLIYMLLNGRPILTGIRTKDKDAYATNTSSRKTKTTLNISMCLCGYEKSKDPTGGTPKAWDRKGIDTLSHVLMQRERSKG